MNSAAERAEEIVALWKERKDRGEALAPEDLVGLYPDIADEIRVRLAAIDLLDRALREASPGSVPVLEHPDFRILREIGRGGMGVVYEAEQVSMRRIVAVKVLYPSITLHPRAVERFRREAQAAGRLHHTHIVPVYGMGEARGAWFYVMERIHGRTLADVVSDMRRLRADGAQDPPTTEGGTTPFTTGGTGHRYYARIAEAFAGLAEALAYAHGQGVLHRDVKPANVMLDQDGTLKLTDFGLARTEGDLVPLTVTGDLIGTPAYMSPEQVRPGTTPVDARTDVYSLGATLYEILTLHPPYEGRTFQEVFSRVLSQGPVPVRRRNPRVPKDLETIVWKAMDRDVGRRYATAGEFAADLTAFACGVTVRARRAGPLAKGWRAVRHHPWRAVGSVVLLGSIAVAGALGVRAAAVERRRIAQEYGGLVEEASRAEFAFYGSIRRGPEPSVPLSGSPRDQVRRLLERAVSLAPSRREAPRLLTLLFPVDTHQLRHWVHTGLLTDREAALVPILWADASLDVRRRALREVPAASGGAEAAFGCILESSVHDLLGDPLRAEELLGAAIDDPACDATLRLIAVYRRHAVRERRGDFARAIEDLAAARVASDMLRRTTDLRLALLWRRAGRNDVAQGLVDGALDRARRRATEQAWIELLQMAPSSNLPPEWLDQLTGEAERAFPRSGTLRSLRLYAQYFRVTGFDDQVDAGRSLAQLGAETGDVDAEVRGLLAMAGALAARGLVEEVRALCARLHGLAPRMSWPDACAGYADLHLANALLNAAQREDGLRVAQGISRVEPDLDASVGVVLTEHGFADEAAAWLEHALSIDPWNVKALLVRASSRWFLCEYENGLQDLDRAAALGAQETDVTFARVRLLAAAGRRDEALNLLRTAVGSSASVPRTHGALGVGHLFLDLGAFDEAEAWLGAGLREAPTFDWAHAYWIDLLIARGRTHALLEELEILRSRVPPSERRILSESDALRALGRLDEALRCLESAPPPRSTARANRRAALLVLLGRGREAYEEWQSRSPHADTYDFGRWFAVHGLWTAGDRDGARRLAAQGGVAPRTRQEYLWQADFDAVAGLSEKVRSTLDRVGSGLNAQEAFARAISHAFLGEGEAALAWLSRSADLGEKRPPVDTAYPGFEPLLGDARFQSIRERMTLRP